MTKSLYKISSVILLLVILLTGCYKETALPVTANFSTAFVNSDESVPVQIAITNQSIGADSYAWTFEGAQPSSATSENPGSVVYNVAGTYTLQLTASNRDGSTDTFEKTITIVDGISINFSTQIIASSYPPVEVVLTNNTEGEDLSYLWTFEGGIPATSTDQHPGNIIFVTPGDHIITLKVSNGFESFSDHKTITVTPDIEAIFDWEVDPFDDDYQAPVTITLINSSINATSYQWTFEGGTSASATNETPKTTFNDPGTYMVTLKADNGKRTHTATKKITIHPNTNIRMFKDIELAINNSHNTNARGAFFSTKLRKVLTADEVTDANGEEIDICFFGLNSSFDFNKFIAPDAVDSNGFIAIPNATHTKFINSQEICGCSASLSAAQFDGMTSDGLLKALTITETSNGLLPFDNSVVPRIVLFETHDGRKGAIKIKTYVNEGASSYIICDIKVQKE
ncbi:PKD repeat protein [Gelidibacter algens]|uniref:PKD repeat protein n=1 Tax=Gelidibacter algens TaxID=49280 RepID=A0A1A7QY75_9FLAO|nr:PKD domain-containing protein [Gelidibacter algens]OBX24970.1 hypothetical protein A9996_12265 [Gelidibacter algens]RAJ19818.1 PKD repeat protein [Gelidibacter algens]